MTETEGNVGPTDLEKKIIRQLEYYFGDINMPRDRFLQESVKEDDGWLTLETMLKFNRLKQICDDCAVIAAAIKKSTSGLLQVSEDGTKVRRNPEKPIPENTAERRDELAARTLYVKGFPVDATLDDLYDFFEPQGQINSLFMRRDMKKKFKGSVFATFETDEDCKKFLEAEDMKYKDSQLIRKYKNDYFKEKAEEKKERIQAQKQKAEKANKKMDEVEEKKNKCEVTEGALLHFKGFTAETTREEIKNLLQDLGDITWVDFNRGDTEAWIRYSEEGKAKEVLEGINKAMDNNVMLNGNKLEGRVLEGEEEVLRWNKMVKDIADRRNRNSKSRQPHKKFGKRPSKATRMKHKGGNCGDAPVAKKAKVEGD